MTTARALLTSAFREGNLVAIAQGPSDLELGEGLVLLNNLMLSQFTMAVGDALREWPVPRKQYTASVDRTYPFLPRSSIGFAPDYNSLIPDNSRIVWDTSDQHVYLASKPQDGALVAVAMASGADVTTQGALIVDGNGRRIGADDTVTYTPDAFSADRWFYRADLAQWQPIAKLALDDDMIFPEEFDDFWICAVFTRLAPRYAKDVPAASAARAGEVQLMLTTRYFQTLNTGSGGAQLASTEQSFSTEANWMTQ